ncbi:hypothetical protein [Pseudomonas syringae]|uniref:hypothetical protein n=1 Tax=Pseudomonas syringae TaxID=317 RepID=UPI0002099187|nr:hypothetical protein [Pseudomonas syringae]MDP5168543.1 hypothetical protein [Pseudomonas syringae pv. aptata str. DSM 50252]
MQNGAPVLNTVIRCAVTSDQFVPKGTLLIGEVASGPKPLTYTFAWKRMQLTNSELVFNLAGKQIVTLNSDDANLVKVLFDDDIELSREK